VCPSSLLTVPRVPGLSTDTAANGLYLPQERVWRAFLGKDGRIGVMSGKYGGNPAPTYPLQTAPDSAISAHRKGLRRPPWKRATRAGSRVSRRPTPTLP